MSDEALVEAVASAIPERLRRVVEDLIKSSSEAAEFIAGHLLTSSSKRKRYEICGQCHEEYDTTENENANDPCKYHPGEREVDQDFLALDLLDGQSYEEILEQAETIGSNHE
ncbi:MAG: hypothetical protein M1820_005555 [Bogoriella megaspora]|nr:MAG: hypothetical protein M1820_005555 [Bogoriella megaspora]